MSRQSVPTILETRRSFCFWPPRIALAMLVLALLRSDGVCASGKMRIQEDFHGNRLDLTQWSVEGAGAERGGERPLRDRDSRRARRPPALRTSGAFQSGGGF